VIKVLVIDDSALVRKLLVRVLASETDFEVSLARDGLEGLDLLHKVKPDVVTLDIYMPQAAIGRERMLRRRQAFRRAAMPRCCQLKR
jgi:chemotaxis response regulator CheB